MLAVPVTVLEQAVCVKAKAFLGIHPGNIQGTFREHLVNVQGTFREDSGNGGLAVPVMKQAVCVRAKAFLGEHPGNIQ
jgi:hypothetical protein